MINCQFKNNELSLLLKSIGKSVELVDYELFFYYIDSNGIPGLEHRFVPFCRGYLDCLKFQRRFLQLISFQLKKHIWNPLLDIERTINFQFRNDELPLLLKSIGRSVSEIDHRVYYFYEDDYDEEIFLNKREVPSCKAYLEHLKVQEKLLSSAISHLKGYING